ncbi:MAG: hypothetical protein M3N00_10390 [Actinomycetota bacterium]|nr:hypothetical protein [Actinomycetota bacterium]
MTRSGIVALIVVVVGIALTGCGRDVREASPSPKRTPAGEALSGTTRPPESTLTLGKRTVTGVLGSYCWESDSGANEAITGCADAAGIPVPREDEALTVPRDWVLVFDYGGRGRSARVDAGAYPLDQEKRSLPGPNGGALLVPRKGRSAMEAKDLRVNRLGDRAQFPVQLPAGEYVVEVSIVVPEGDAAYYFRIVVV